MTTPPPLAPEVRPAGPPADGEEWFLVVGGQQRRHAHLRPEWQRHERGVVLAVAPATGQLRRLLDYVSPPEVTPPQPSSILFKAASLCGDRLVLCTQTEVLVYDLATMRRVEYLSLPLFNDLHHVLPTPRGTLLLAVTGLDLVAEVTPEGALTRCWGVLGQDPWQRFERATDYRRWPTTKPHQSHPNYVFCCGDEVWVTRFEQRDAVCLTAPARRIALEVERPHDGIVCGERVYFTTVDGQVVVARLADAQVERVVDLNRIVGNGWALGWCRGLAVLDEGRRVVVGFSRLRPTQLRENLRWLKHRFGLRETPGNLPARIACFDLESERQLWEQELESAGMSVVFSIHRVPGGAPWRSQVSPRG